MRKRNEEIRILAGSLGEKAARLAHPDRGPGLAFRHVEAKHACPVFPLHCLQLPGCIEHDDGQRPITLLAGAASMISFATSRVSAGDCAAAESSNAPRHAMASATLRRPVPDLLIDPPGSLVVSRPQIATALGVAASCG